MITKTANTFFGALSGAMSSSVLTPEEKQTLKEEYGLDAKANLLARNAARGAIGGGLGAGAVSLMGKLRKRPPTAVGQLLGVGAGMAGGGVASVKYSKPNAAAIRLNKIEEKLKQLEAR
jgi:hypothetical protein